MDVCLFCQKGNEEDDLHQVLTFDADTNIRTMITELKDTILLSRIDGGDLIAKETMYHLKCLVNLRWFEGYFKNSVVSTFVELCESKHRYIVDQLFLYLHDDLYSH